MEKLEEIKQQLYRITDKIYQGEYGNNVVLEEIQEAIKHVRRAKFELHKMEFKSK